MVKIMIKHLLTLVFLASGSFVCAGLQDKLVAKSEAINVIRQNIQTGKPIILSNECKVRSCKFRCKM